MGAGHMPQYSAGRSLHTSSANFYPFKKMINVSC